MNVFSLLPVKRARKLLKVKILIAHDIVLADSYYKLLTDYIISFDFTNDTAR